MARPIIFFGSSLNPPTLAHLALVEHMIEQTKNDDPRPIIVIAPVYQHIYTSTQGKEPPVDYNARVHMTQVLFEKQIAEGNVIVSDIEKIVKEDALAQAKAKDANADLSKVSCGTADVFSYLKDHPQLIPDGDVNHISLMLGGDTYKDFMGGKWREAERILDLCDTVHVFDRDGLAPPDPQTVISNARSEQNVDNARLAKLDAIANKLNELGAQEFGTKFKLQQGAITDQEIQRISSTNIRNDITHAIKGLARSVLDLIRKEYHHLFKSTREEREQMEKAKAMNDNREGTDSPLLNASPTAKLGKQLLDDTAVNSGPPTVVKKSQNDLD